MSSHNNMHDNLAELTDICNAALADSKSLGSHSAPSPPPPSDAEDLANGTRSSHTTVDLLDGTAVAQLGESEPANSRANDTLDLLGDEIVPSPLAAPTKGAAATSGDGLAGGPGGTEAPTGAAAAPFVPLISFDEPLESAQHEDPSKPTELGESPSRASLDSPAPQSRCATVETDTQDFDGLDGGHDSLQVNSGSEPASPVSPGAEAGASDAANSDPPGSAKSDGDDRPVDSDREVVEEEDAFGDFADFTTASHFMPGAGLGFSPGAGASSQPPPPSASAVAAAAGAVRASGPGGSSSGSPASHRHAYHGGGFPARPAYGGLSASGGGAQPHAGPASTTSEPASFGADFSDFHASPPPSVAQSRAGGGRKSVASLASVGSRAGGDDDVGDFGSVVGSSVWRAPSHMATSSYAAAAGADDDFGDFTSDITSQSDFAPSTQPPSAVAVSGPGSVHQDDDFGSFASHRSNADEDDDDFGNFNAAPAAAGAAGVAAVAAAGAAAAAAAAGSGPSGSSPAAAAPALPPAATAPGLSSAQGQGGAAAALSPGAGSLPSPRDAAASAGAVSASHSHHSAQAAVSAPGGGGAEAAAEPSLLQLPSEELRNAVARALQPLLPPGSPLAAAPLLPGLAVPEDQVAAAWAQLRRHVQGALADGAIAAYNGMPLPPLPGSAEAAEAQAAAGSLDGPAGRGGYVPAVKYSRPLRWKGSDSERRLLTSLGLSELAAQARAAEAVEGPRPGVRSRSDRPGSRPLGRLASFGDAPPRRACTEAASAPVGGPREVDADTSAAGSGASSSSRARGLDPNSGSAGSLLDLGNAGAGATPRPAGAASGNGHAVQQGQQASAASESANGSAQAS